MIKSFYQLTKPGIVYANLLTAAAGYLLATRWQIHWLSLTALLVGVSMVIASACVLNNYLDRGLDAKMKRTRCRVLVTGKVSIKQAEWFAVILAAVGFGALAYTNGLTLIIGAGAMFSYVVLYGIAKRISMYGTLVGTVPGATSLLAGYTTATDKLDIVALTLFLTMVAWQLAHFYAIATYRLEDYAAAGLPVWPVKRGVSNTKQQILSFIGLFIIFALLLTVLHYTGYTYAVIMLLVGGYWFWVALQGFKAKDDSAWARRTFYYSLFVILVFAIILSFGRLLP